MTHKKFDRTRLAIRSLAMRKNQLFTDQESGPVSHDTTSLKTQDKQIVRETARRIISARKNQRSVILAFGAHTIKNGLAPLLIALIREGWVTHLATNGAGIIHDWEFAFQGSTGEDVRENVKNGQFGIWEETGFYINMALLVGAYEGLGYGESIGQLISCEGLNIPESDLLRKVAEKQMQADPDRASAAIDLLDAINKKRLSAGFLRVLHPYKSYSVQCAAYDLKVPFTGHPMFGHDIIYTHPINNGAAVGRTALKDFLSFTQSVSNIDHGVYMSVGSAVMSPMIFEKSLSMAQNIAIQNNSHIDNHFMIVVDLAKADWDWSKNGEPAPDNPSYYLRYCKTFSRMGGEMHYLNADNRDFLTELYRNLSEESSD